MFPRASRFTIILLFALLVLAIPHVFLATNRTERPSPQPLVTEEQDPEPRLRGTPLFRGAASETVFYGGTQWDATDERWEAMPGGLWTFESGVASAINTDSTKKAVGLHSLMEGWTGLDLTTPALDENPWHRSSQCALHGSWSLWAGLTETQADSLGWKSGQGYGDDWDYSVAKTFQYPGSGTVRLLFDFHIETEPAAQNGGLYDYLEVDVESPGRSSDAVWWATGSDGRADLTLSYSLPKTAAPVTIRFRAYSDGAYSDEDGLVNTQCGHSAIDNIVLQGALNDVSDFESGLNGWEIFPPLGPGGDWSDIRSTTSVGPSCSCSFGDSVLTFIDPRFPYSYSHGPDQQNVAISPWIDLAADGRAGWAGKVVQFAGATESWIRDYVWVGCLIRWKPEDLPSPTGLSRENGFYYVGGVGTASRDTCYCPDGRRSLDLSQYIPPNAEAIQIGLGVVNYCRWFSECSYTNNDPPWFDDVRIGLYEQPLPSASLSAYDRDLARDVFPPGSGNLATRTARFDAHVIEPGGAFQDNLFVYTDYNPGPSRVDVVFRIRPGPGIDSGRLNTWLATFPSEGNGWVSARMDTVVERRDWPPGMKWQTTFHENDPHFVLPDYAAANNIFPDNLFTPGTRVDYFFRWTTDLDPSAVSFLPDTTGGHAFEMEVLPSSIVLSPQVENNSVLLVQRTEIYYYDSPERMKSMVDSALSVLLPGGSANAENRAWDRFDIPFRQDLFPSNVQNYYQNDASLLGLYDTILWLSHTNTIDIGPLDSATLMAWLNSGSKSRPHRLYLANHSEGANVDLYSALGVAYYRADVHYRPETGEADNSHCIEVLAEPGAPFGAGFQRHLISYDEAAQLTPAASTADAIHATNLVYQMPVFGRVEAASVNTYVSQGSKEWRSVVDGFFVSRLRATNDCSGSPDGAVERLGAVLSWFDSPPPVPVKLLSFSGVWEGSRLVLSWSVAGAAADHAGFHVFRQTSGQDRVRLTSVPIQGGPEYRFVDESPPPEGALYWLGDLLRDGSLLWLGPYAIEGSKPARLAVHAGTNPFSHGTDFHVELPNSGPVRIRIFDLSGHEITTLQPGTLGPGFAEVAWDGRNGQGRPVSTGMYVYRLEAGGRTLTGKVVKVDRN